MTTLIEAGADLSLQNSNGDTPAHLAMRGCGGVIRVLNSAGAANASIQNNHGDTPVHISAAESSYMIDSGRALRAILEAEGVDLSIQNRDGNTPLHCCAQGKCKDDVRIPQILLDAGADVSIRNRRGKTAADVAADAGYVNVAALLTCNQKGA